MNIDRNVPFLTLLYTLPMNINVYIPFLKLLYNLPMNINEYVLFIILLYTLAMNINLYVPFLINMLDTFFFSYIVFVVYCLAPEAPMLGRMPTRLTGPKVFLAFAGRMRAAALHPDQT